MATRAAIEPVTKSVEVEVGIERAFELFTREMTQWWPLHMYSIAEDTFEGRVKAERVVFEEREGGRIYEVMSDGTEGPWGTVLAWDPPRRVVFTWKPNLTDGPSTEVEVRFSPVASGTKVELEHRGWERFGADARDRRAMYESGWPGVLERYRAASAG